MTDSRRRPLTRLRRRSSDAGRILIVFTPILAVIAVTAVLAVIAWYVGWYRTEMLIAAAGAGGAAALAAVGLLYVQMARQRDANRALRNAEARVSGIVESAMDPIITVDESQRIIVFNAAAEQVFGWPRDAVMGEPLDKLLPDRFRHGHHANVERFGRTGITSRRMGNQTLLMALRATGEEFPIEASISQHSDGGSKLYTVILRDVTERARTEVALRKSKEELQELGVAAQQALEREKTRIARELHDELAQSLAALQMDVAWSQENGAGDWKAVERKLDRMHALLDSTVAATRRIASDLRPLMLDDLGLVPAVEWLVENFTQRHGVRCELAVSSAELDLPDTHATAAFRIVQESLANIAKHARASRVEVAIDRLDDELSVSIRDDGIGFAPAEERKPDSYGLLGLRERASLLGGDAVVISAPGSGTLIDVRLPVHSSEDLR